MLKAAWHRPHDVKDAKLRHQHLPDFYIRCRVRFARFSEWELVYLVPFRFGTSVLWVFTVIGHVICYVVIAALRTGSFAEMAKVSFTTFYSFIHGGLIVGSVISSHHGHLFRRPPIKRSPPAANQRLTQRSNHSIADMVSFSNSAENVETLFSHILYLHSITKSSTLQYTPLRLLCGQ